MNSVSSLDYTNSVTPSVIDPHVPKRIIRGSYTPTKSSKITGKGKGKGKGPNGECCGCGGENCDNKELKKYSDW